MIQATRVMVFDRLDAFRFDLDPRMVSEAPYVSEVNGEHSLAVVTTMELEKTNRLLVRDCMGVWHEYVVAGITETHADTKEVEREYYCVWSLQYDLSATFVDDPYGCGIVPGHASVPKPARTAMDIALGGTSRWRVGSITVTTMAAASFYRCSGWKAMKTVVEKWGGEVQATITVDKHGVVSRSVDLLTQVGATTATRRFDYGHDVTSIKRTYSDEIWPCRIIPLGKSQETEAGGYTRRPTIESVNGGCMWLEDSAITPLVRVPDGSGDWEYPTLIVENDTYEEPADLKAWAEENITDYTRPQVSYEANVAQFVRAGLNPHGVALGDAIVVVDHTFGTQGLRINARVKRETGDLYDASKTAYTIGTVARKMSTRLSRLTKQVDRMAETADRSTWYQATDDYLSNLLSRINYCVNADGGYTYITEGEGIRTYDYPVSDPLVGDEATKVVEIKGGTIRIANSRTAGGDWDWKTVFVSGHVAAELVTAAQIVAGYIRSPNGTFIDLDNDTAQLGATAGPHTTWDSTGMEVYDGDGNSVAKYGSDARIGRIDGGYVLISHNSLILFDMDGVPYLRVQDRRRADGLYVYEHSYKGDASAQTKWRHSITEMPEQGNAPVPIYAALDGTEIPFVAYSTSGAGYPTTLGVFAAIRWYLGYANVVTYNRTSSSSYDYYELPPDETVLVRFACECDLAKDYTIGTRAAGAENGIGSIAIGHDCSATNRRSIAIGASPDATAQDALAIGTDASASGQYSVAIGDGATVMGANGVAIGHGAVAGGLSGNGYYVNIADRIMFDGYGKPYFSHDRDTSVETSVLTTSSLFTFINFRFVRSGRVAMLSFDWSYSFAISVADNGNVTDLQIGTLIEGFRPAAVVHPVSNGNNAAWYHINTSGAIVLCAVEGTGVARAIAANTTFSLACTYITA